MRKFTFIFIVLFLTFAQDIRITEYVDPQPNGNVTNYYNDEWGKPFTWHVKVKNFGSIAVPAGSLLYMYLIPSGSSSGQLASIDTTKAAMAVNETINFYFETKIHLDNPPQAFYFGFGVMWNLHPSASCLLTQYPGFYIVAGMENFSQSINKFYYNDGNLYLNLNDISQFKTDNAQLVLCNITGQTILNEHISLYANTDLVVSTGNLPKGIYIVKLITTEGVATRKFIVQ